jgi:hypothetical protein
MANDPSAKSSDYTANAEYWQMASDIIVGTEAMRAAVGNAGRIGGSPIAYQNLSANSFARQLLEAESPYLPRFPNEDWSDYNRRRCNAFFTNIYGDILNNLSSKPFSKECHLVDSSGEDIKKYSENIDGLGNNLHVFASDAFKTAINKAITWILIEYTKVPAGATLADERDLGARPYWVHIPAEKLLAVYSKFLNGTEVIFHARIDEPCVEVDGYEEKSYNRVRVMNREPIYDDSGENITGFGPAYWELWQEDKTKDAQGREVTDWNIIDGGFITIGIIPLVPVLLGKRDGTSWRVQAPLRDLAFMQVKLFQMESNLDSIKELTAFPMLSGNGISGTQTDMAGTTTQIKVPVGPRAVLFAPPNADGNAGSWAFIEPAGSSLTFLQEDIDKHKIEMRDLGMQPLSAANLTVVTTANLSLKASSACQAWSLALKDALEQAWKITMMWLKQKIEPEVVVFTDFAVKVDGTDIADIAQANTDGVISKELRFTEMKRRGVLSDDADWKKDQAALAKETSNDVLKPEVHIDPVTGMPVAVTPEHGDLNPPPKQPIKIKPGEKIVAH